MLKHFIAFIESLIIVILAAVFFLLISTFLPTSSYPASVEIQEATINYKYFFPGGWHPLINDNGLPDRHLDQSVNLTVNTDFFKYLYWNNEVLSLTDRTSTGRGQFRYVAWHFDIGLRVFKNIDVSYYHKSEHLLDHQLDSRFPVADGVQVNIILYRANAKPGLLDIE